MGLLVSIIIEVEGLSIELTVYFILWKFLIDSENPLSQTWLPMYGRKIRASHAIPLQKFDVAENCCTVCVRMQRRSGVTALKG